jgi:ankyrin repeat protein
MLLPTTTAKPNVKDAFSISLKGTDPTNSDNKNAPTRRSSRIKKNDEIQQAKAKQQLLFSNLYSSPSSLVRTMMFLGCVEEDSTEFVTAESQASSSDHQAAVASSWISLRASRSWQTEHHRVEVVRMLTDAYPEGMAVACNHDKDTEKRKQEGDFDIEGAMGGGGDTPFIMACRTFKGGILGEEDDDEDFNMNVMNMEGNEPAGDAMNDDADAAAAALNDNEAVVAEAGEEEVDYEADLPDKEITNENDDLDKKPASVESVSTDENPVEDNEESDVRHDNVQPLALGGNNEEEEELNQNDPLGAIITMIAASRRINDLTALLTANDDGDTPLHMASRIGCHRRLIHLLLNAEPRPASMNAKDDATPLHLIVRRCSHLAPGGVGGLSTYDAEIVQLMVNAAGRDAMFQRNADFRTPLHEACYYGASPDVLEVLAEAEGGREALLLRDREGYSPLGTYCRHAADFYAMRVLCDYCPEAAACMADGRRLPLHRVLTSFNLAVNVDVLNLLGMAYPRGIDTKDSHGMTPLALLCHTYKGPMNADLPKLHSNQTTLGRW